MSKQQKVALLLTSRLIHKIKAELSFCIETEIIGLAKVTRDSKLITNNSPQVSKRIFPDQPMLNQVNTNENQGRLTLILLTIA